MNGATTIQERLKDLRLNKGLKLEELAEQTGISKSALGSYEKDDYKEINHGNLILLADFYGVSLDYLFCRTENRAEINTPLRELHLSDEINNVRFVETSEAKIWTGTGCPSGLAVFGTLVLGAHAYATTELEGGGLQHIVKQLGYGDDPLNQRASVGWKAVKTAERLSEQYMVRIESCSARYSAKAKAN